jgi:pimeloyl-ACP methyl ester carboxylesterase
VITRKNQNTKNQVILLHGWSGRWDQMLSVADKLLSENYEVVTFDFPSHGANQGSETDFFEMSEFLSSVYKTLQIKEPIIVCHSAAFLVVSHCSLIHSIKFSKLITIDSPARFEYPMEMLIEKLRLPVSLNKELWKIIERKVKIKDPQRQLTTHHLSVLANETVLIINDENDKEVKFSEGLEMSKIWPKAKRISTQGLGHNRILQNKKIIEDVFLFCQN